MNLSNESLDRKERVKVEEKGLNVSSQFVNAISAENAIKLTILEAGIVSKSDRAFVFLYKKDDQKLILTNEWSKSGLESKKIGGKKLRDISWISNQLKDKTMIQINNIENFYGIKDQLNKFFTNLEIQSIIIHELKIREKRIGFIFFCSKEINYNWKKEDFLIFQIASDIISSILEKQYTIEQLNISEKKYRNIIENIEDAIIILDLDGRFMYLSPQYLKYIGENARFKEEIDFERIHPKDRKVLFKLFSEALKRKKVIYTRPIQYRILHKKGHYVWISSTSKNYYDEQGQVIGFVSTMRDITKLKTVEKQFIETEEQYHSFIDNFQGIAYQADNINSNPYFFKGNVHDITGYMEEDFNKGLIKLEDLIFYEDYAIRQNEVKKIKEIPDYIIDIVYRINDKNGNIKWVREIIKNILSESKNKSFIQGTLHDISNEVLIDEKLKISEGKYKRITENANDLIVVFNQDYQIEYLNENVHQKLLGYSPEELKSRDSLDFIHPQDHDIIKQGLKKIFEEGEGSLETKLIHKNGEPMWFHLKGSVFIDVDNKEKILVFARDIAFQKKVEQKIKESEKKYRLITENANDIICIIDDKFILEYVNEEPCYRIMGYRIEEVVGTNILNLLYKEDVDPAIKILNHTIMRGEGMIETRVRHKNGQFLWLDIKGHIYYNEKDELKIIFTARDISFRKNAEKELKKSEEKLRTFMNSATDAFFIWDSTLNLIDISDIGVKEYLPEGTIKEEIIGKNIIDFIPDIKESEVYKMLKNILKTGEPIAIQRDLEIPSMIKRYISLKAFKVSEGLGMIISDTTKQKLADDKLKESERKYKQLFETSPYAILLVSLDGKIIDCNTATEEIFGFKKQEIFNRKVREITSLYTNYWDEMVEGFQKGIMGNESEPTELQIYKKDGTLVWVLIHLNLVRLGSEYLVQAIVLDITANKRAEELIKQEIERLRELDQIRNDLVRRISHELKTPLISIFSISQHLIENYRDDLNEKTLKLISTIHKGGKRLKLLSDNLINSLRLEASGITLNLKNQDLVKIIDESIESFEIFINERNILIKKETPKEFFFKIDEIWINQVISNLLSNAIKNTPKRGAIFIKLLEENDYIEIIVRDTGVGLTEREKERLFTRFGKFERFNEELDIIFEGSGLGLYISREIVQLHNGEIVVKSKGRNKGSIFIIRLFKTENEQ